MTKLYFFSTLANHLRRASNWPGFVQFKYTFRRLQAQTHQAEFSQIQNLTVKLPLGPLLNQQPRFIYKYLSHYAAAGFSRAMRLTAILHHYQFMAAAVRPVFFNQLIEQPLIWQVPTPSGHFSIRLSYPIKAHFEGELSLHFYASDTLLQILTFVVVPGALVGTRSASTLLISQVQGTPQSEAIRLATKQLYDITPASLLVHAAYGLAEALGIDHATGIGSYHQLGRGAQSYFDYDAFWQQFQGQLLRSGFHLLDVGAPEKPIEEIKAKYRTRTLRKRAYKQQVRQAIATSFQTYFMQVEQEPAPYAYALAS